MHRSKLYIIGFVFIPYMLAYLLSELYRNVNSVVGPIVQSDLNISVETLGLMTSLFLASVAGSQIFVGILLDRYGTRRTVSVLLLFAVLGALLFSTGQFESLLVGRFLIGIGMAGCWTAAFKANNEWWPRERLALANGITIGLAGFGSLAATLPTQLLLEVISWEMTFVILAGLTLLISLLLFFVAPEPTHVTRTTQNLPIMEEFRGFMVVLKNPVFVRIAPLSVLCQGVWLAYQGLWAGIWLREVNGFSSVSSAYFLLYLAIAIVAGNLLLSFVADQFSRRGISISKSMLYISFLFIGVQCVIAANPGIFTAYLWSVFGLFLAGPIFAYALISQALPANYSGRAVSLLNLFATLAGFSMQYGVGFVISHWVPYEDGTYPVLAHQTAIGIIILAQLVALLWALYSPVAKRPATTMTWMRSLNKGTMLDHLKER